MPDLKGWDKSQFSLETASSPTLAPHVLRYDPLIMIRPWEPLMTFAILGYGRFGRMLATHLATAGYRVHVFDPTADVPAIWRVASGKAAVRHAHWIILAMPVSHMERALRVLRPHLHAHHTVIDVASVKETPCRWMTQILGDAIPFVGTHPLFGPLSIARGERPLRVVLCPSNLHPAAADRTRALVKALGWEIIESSASEHDRAMATTHVTAFFLARALVDMGIGEDLAMAPPSFLSLRHMLDAVRADAGHLFTTIQRDNAYAADARVALIEALMAIHQRLARDDASLTIPMSTAADLSSP